MLHRVRHNRKGMAAFEAVMWIMRSLILVYVLLSIIFVTGSFLMRSIDTRLAESYVIMNKMYYSGNIMPLKDTETGRVYPGIVNPANPGTLDGTFSYDEADNGQLIAARAAASLPDGNAKKFTYIEDLFNDWNLLYRAGLTQGVGGVKKVSTAKNLQIVQANKKFNSNVTVEVVIKNV